MLYKSTLHWVLLFFFLFRDSDGPKSEGYPIFKNTTDEGYK